MKIRHYGLFASRQRGACLETCRQVIPAAEAVEVTTPVKPAPQPRCQRCQSERVHCQLLPDAWLFSTGQPDSS